MSTVPRVRNPSQRKGIFSTAPLMLLESLSIHILYLSDIFFQFPPVNIWRSLTLLSIKLTALPNVTLLSTDRAQLLQRVQDPSSRTHHHRGTRGPRDTGSLGHIFLKHQLYLKETETFLCSHKHWCVAETGTLIKKKGEGDSGQEILISAPQALQTCSVPSFLTCQFGWGYTIGKRTTDRSPKTGRGPEAGTCVAWL